jgi:hypothetical protein
MMTLLLSLGLLGQTPPNVKEVSKDPAARLEYMKKAVAAHALRPANGTAVTYRLGEEPLLRFTNTVGTVTDGTIFFWFDADNRPVAAVQVYRTKGGTWHQAFSSLSTIPMTTGGAWNPTRGGVEFKPLPDAPKPAATPEQRLRQMREMAGGFGVEMNFELNRTAYHLRPLTKPLARYGKAKSDVIDGAVFGFVLTTDPEAYLLLEARESKDGLEWHYAFAPEANSPIRCTWKGKEAWSFEFVDNGSTAPYFDWNFSSEP